jgi:hypothetical protein
VWIFLHRWGACVQLEWYRRKNVSGQTLTKFNASFRKLWVNSEEKRTIWNGHIYKTGTRRRRKKGEEGEEGLRLYIKRLRKPYDICGKTHCGGRNSSRTTQVCCINNVAPLSSVFFSIGCWVPSGLKSK